jgi:hypothetical protein
MKLPEIIEYSCHMSFEPLSDEKLRLAHRLIDASGLGFDIGEDYLEFDYSGRDTNRKVTRLLAALASIVGDASGEAQCTLAWEDSDATFEFYSIKNHRLMRQKAHIVREPEEVAYSPDDVPVQELVPTAA